MYFDPCRPSGSGKTTLLNTLACRLDRNTKVKLFFLSILPYNSCLGTSRYNHNTMQFYCLNALAAQVVAGELLLNGKSYRIAELKKMSGYVMQVITSYILKQDNT